MGQLGTDESGVQNAIEGEIPDIGARTGDQLKVFHSADGGAENRSSHGADPTDI
jgi:hypothetical protein